MPTDEGLLVLIERGHVSSVDRNRYGYVGHDVVPFDRLVDVVVNALRTAGRFPRERDACDSPEGMWIVKEGAGYVVWASRTEATEPETVAERTKRRFLSPGAAVRFYLKWSCQLPGVLDGVAFV